MLAVAARLYRVAAAEPAPPSKPVRSDVPPPLVPAMALPDNAVDNAVAKLDGIAEDLMKQSGIPGMAVAVVHGGKTVYAKGFGVKDVNTAVKRSTPTRCSSWRRCPSRSAPPSSPIRSV